jgi:uncharacterized ion transporter superfamily protein YfcC
MNYSLIQNVWFCAVGSKNVQYDKSLSEQYWQSNKQQPVEQQKPQKTTPAIDASARQKVCVFIFILCHIDTFFFHFRC